MGQNYTSPQSENNLTKSRPHLPLHDQSTTDLRRRAFCCIDGHGCRFRSDSKAESKSGNEHVPPGIDEALPEAGNCTKKTGDENSTPTSEPIVIGGSEPATDKCATKVGSTCNKPGKPGRSLIAVIDTELWKEE